ncbi:hypothetical protein F511_30065 [Dorcoceras hygrometricum]|uniref:Uncharacterized protein n=1 Tax=Dorcoceras hygrometricum TaxID=472368 RepID=A0A2Z7D0X4_9LAMI|nr:hypothetical protein F511_30065 [Dorcoceras hygrometricum]
MELHDLFANLKAYEFELETRSEAEPSTAQPTKALAATTQEQSSPSKKAEQLSNDVMSLFVKKLGHFAANFKKPKKYDMRSTERRRNRFEKRPNKMNDRKVLVAEERNNKWADSDSETTSSSSSGESEQEEVHCLMANQTTNDELSQTFEEIKAENNGLKNSSAEPSTAQLGESDSLQTELNLADDKFKKMNFFNASVIHDAYELVKYDDQTMGQLNHKGKTGIGYIKPENSKPSWLTNRLEKDKAKAGPNWVTSSTSCMTWTTQQATNKPSPRGTWGQTPVRRANKQQRYSINKNADAMHETPDINRSYDQQGSQRTQGIAQSNLQRIGGHWRLAGHLSGTCAWLQPVFQEPGASRLIAVDSSIRSTTRLEAPSSDCTRSPDEISTIGFSTSNWPEQISGDDRA